MQLYSVYIIPEGISRLPTNLKNDLWYKWYAGVMLDDISLLEGEKNLDKFHDSYGNNLLHMKKFF